MESVWTVDRIRLYQLSRDNPEWSQRKLAEHLGYSLSWVKKWLRIARNAVQVRIEIFQGKSRAPHTRPREVHPLVRDAILEYRDQLKAKYGRVVGPKTILYHLSKDTTLWALGYYVPRSVTTIWKILKDAGRIPKRVREHHALELPQPMEVWEIDFGQLGNQFEFFPVIDRGTSRFIHCDTHEHFNAETTLISVAKFLLLNGLPKLIRMDNDTRFVGSWSATGFPSALMRFLWCLGVEPYAVEPGKPYYKPFVERLIRTLKHESLWEKKPSTAEKAAHILDDFRLFYNQERAHQGIACNNRPPAVAFPNLPALPPVPQQVDPDAWLRHYHGKLFKRKVNANGIISVGRHTYYLGYKLAKEVVGVNLDAKLRVFHFLHPQEKLASQEIQGLIGKPMSFQAFLAHMIEEARTETD